MSFTSFLPSSLNSAWSNPSDPNDEVIFSKIKKNYGCG